MHEALPRPRTLRDPLGRVEGLLRRDFPDVTLRLTLDPDDLGAERARAQVVSADMLPLAPNAEPGTAATFWLSSSPVANSLLESPVPRMSGKT